MSSTLWELFTTVDNASNLRHQQVDQETVTVAVTGGIPSDVAFVRGPSFLEPLNHQISLAAYQTGMPGPVYRSGRHDTLPDQVLVDVMLVERQVFALASLNDSISASLPFTLSDGTVVSSASIAPGAAADLVLTATGVYGAATFTYTLTFTIDVWDDQWDPTHLMAAQAQDRGSITFAGNGTPGGAIQALVDNIFAGLVIGRVTASVIATITARINSAAVAAGAQAAGAVGLTALPPGVQLGVRSVRIAANGDVTVTPSISCEGSLVDRFVAAAPPGAVSGRCFVATAAVGGNHADVCALRRWRDREMLTTRRGRVFVRVYEAVSPPIARMVARSPLMRSAARLVVVRPAARLARHRLNRAGRRGSRPRSA